MKKLISFAFAALLILSTLVGCGSSSDTNTNDTITTSVSLPKTSEPVTTEEEIILSRPKIEPIFTSKPFVDSSTIQKYTWEELQNYVASSEFDSIIRSIPSTYYESYPDLIPAPIEATFYNNGEVTKIDVMDPRMVRLFNFYNNNIYHQQHGYLQGTYNAEQLEEIKNTPDRMVLKFRNYGSRGECKWDTMIITEYGFDVIDHTFDKNPEGFYATSRDPLNIPCNWIERFGF